MDGAANTTFPLMAQGGRGRSGRSPTGSTVRPLGERLADGPVRHRARIGEIEAEIRAFPAQQAAQLRATRQSVLLVAALQGGAEIVCESGSVSIDTQAVALIARREPATVLWRAGSRELVLHLPRARLQAAASAAHGGARRLANAPPRRMDLIESEQLGAALIELGALLADEDADLDAHGPGLDERLVRDLLAALARSGAIDEALPPSRSVSEAMRRVREAPDQPWDAASLAAAVGVTVPVLRRNFRALIGQSIGTFVLQTRLGRARERLASAHDSRPLSEVAKSVGFQTQGAFSRAYVRLFGEAPSQTRACAVRNAQIQKKK